ncbi:MAG TPA: peptidylprolyl isomerase [Anaeromyxobacteraceae bacterium]|jgi:parvulin-like peptidyl-prolyl isomerase|nr:peptidylprolyl isomerase [Anaeromyxobacteraceae bacterium]
MIGLALLALLAAAPPAFPALVNGKPITEPEVRRAMIERIRKQYFHRQLEPKQIAKLRKEVIADLVRDELRAQEARQRGLVIDMAPIRKEVAGEEHAAGGQARLDAALSASGIDRLRYLEVIERPEQAKALADAEVASKTRPIGSEEARAFFRANLARYRVPGALKLQELCVRVDPSSDDKGWEAGREKAAALRARILKGDDFTKLAREQRCDKFAAQGGELGFVHQGSLEPGMEKVAWALRDGQVSEPVRALRGWHLLRREATQPTREARFEEIEESVKAELREAHKVAALKKLDADLRARARIVVREEKAS